MRNRFLLTFILALGAFAATDWNEAGKQWWSHVQYLASDELGGRDVGSPGFQKAASYVAEQFERAGLQPGGEGNYFQRVQFTKISLDQSKSSIAIVRNERITPVPIP
ncbi:MAG: peptidase M28, partial [Bryobacteraceae bacterium]